MREAAHVEGLLPMWAKHTVGILLLKVCYHDTIIYFKGVNIKACFGNVANAVITTMFLLLITLALAQIPSWKKINLAKVHLVLILKLWRRILLCCVGTCASLANP